MSPAIQQQTSDNSLNPNKRIEYIDALRGFTMFLVVFQHVATFCWQINGKGISIHDYMMQIRMPMFFFISGFVLYKSSVVWNWKQVTSFFRKKIPVQLISPFIFFSLFVYLNQFGLSDSIAKHYKHGYWFTLVLFEYYCFYAIIRFCIRSKWSLLPLLCLGIVLYLVNMPLIYDNIPFSAQVKGVLSVKHWKYFLFFVLGTTAKQYFHPLEKLLDGKWFLPLCISIYLLGNGYRRIIPINGTLFSLILTLSGLVVLFSFFRVNQKSLSKETIAGRTLQYVGHHTLDIYLIHFFLIPHQLSRVTIFLDHPMPIIEAAVSLIIASIIIAGSLLIGNIIRLSPVLAHWVFGAKYPKKNSNS